MQLRSVRWHDDGSSEHTLSPKLRFEAHTKQAGANNCVAGVI